MPILIRRGYRSPRPDPKPLSQHVGAEHGLRASSLSLGGRPGDVPSVSQHVPEALGGDRSGPWDPWAGAAHEARRNADPGAARCLLLHDLDGVVVVWVDIARAVSDHVVVDVVRGDQTERARGGGELG